MTFVCHEEETIVAQSTPQGAGALALVRLSGKNARDIANAVGKFGSKKSLLNVSTHTIHYGWVYNSQGNKIDQVLFLVMDGPHTFTGENTVEITCHNNQFIVEALINCCIYYGARLAKKGEFSQRAVMNGKIDVLQAEAINELVHANTAFALSKSLAQLDGSFSRWASQVEQELIKARALSDASFEFIDEEIGFSDQIQVCIDQVLSTINHVKKTFAVQKYIRQGVRIALVGSVNVGKSSLFNCLVNNERAIVTPLAGTTRDVIESGVYKNGTYRTFIDTAGLRETGDVIEKEGIARSYREVESADIIMLVMDGSRMLAESEHDEYMSIVSRYSDKIICIVNKADLDQKISCSFLKMIQVLNVSSKHPSTKDEIEQCIEKKIKQLFDQSSTPFLINKRHYEVLIGLEKKLEYIQEMLSKDPEYELISFHLSDALGHISEFTGKTIDEQAMDHIFRSFCIGK